MQNRFSRHLLVTVAMAAALLLAPVAVAFAAPDADTAVAAKPPQAPELPHVAAKLAAGQGLYIVAFGSSSTEGVGASSKLTSYPSRLAAEMSANLSQDFHLVVENRGIGGDDVDDMMKRIGSIIAEKPDLVIWQTGTNDPFRNVPIDHFDAETKRGIDAFKAAGIDVMMMEPQLCARMLDTAGSLRYRDAVRQISAEEDVPNIRRYAMMEDWLATKRLTAEQMLSPDGTHMADGGYHLLAQAVASAVLGNRLRHFAAD